MHEMVLKSLFQDIHPSAFILMSKKLMEKCDTIFKIPGCSGEQLLSLVGTFGLSEQQTNAGHHSVGHCLFVNFVHCSLGVCIDFHTQITRK